MRVIHIGHVPLPAGHPLGVSVSGYAFHPGRWVLNLAIAQRKHAGIDAEIVIKVPGATQHWDTVIEGVPCHFVPVPNILRGKTFFFLDQRILARAAMQLHPDLVDAHGTEEANALAALRCPVPNVLTVQGCFFIINRVIRPRFFSRGWIVERLERRSIPQFQDVITKSEYVRRDILREFPKLRTHVIPNTYDPRLEAISIGQPKERALAYVGSIDPRKGVDILLRALETLKAIGTSSAEDALPDLHVFGDRQHGATDYEEAQKQNLRSLLGEKLHLHGLTPQIEMAAIVARCRALIAPSREEMFGNQIIEALLVGTHVIVTGQTAMAENVQRFGNGTVVPQEAPDALAVAIASALGKDADITKANSARSKIQEYMGPGRVALEHRKLYEEILARR